MASSRKRIVSSKRNPVSRVKTRARSVTRASMSRRTIPSGFPKETESVRSSPYTSTAQRRMSCGELSFRRSEARASPSRPKISSSRPDPRAFRTNPLPQKEVLFQKDQAKQQALHRARLGQPGALGLIKASRMASKSTKRMLSSLRPNVNKNAIIFVGFNQICGSSLAEQVFFGLHEEIPGRSGSRFVRVVSNDGDGYPGGLAHHQLGGGGELVGGSEHARGEGEPVGVRLPAVIG